MHSITYGGQQQAFEYDLCLVNFNRVIFRPIELFKLIGSWFPERAAKIYSVLSRVNQQSPLQ